MSVVFMKYTDSFVLFRENITTLLIPFLLGELQRPREGVGKCLSLQFLPEISVVPVQVVGLVTRDANFICFSQALPCFQPSCGFPLYMLTFQTSHIHSFSHVLILTCSFSCTCPHTCSHTHTLVHTQVLSPLSHPPMALDSSCPFLPLLKDRPAPLSRASNGSLPWGLLFLHSHLFSNPAKSCSCLPGVWFL